MMRVANTVIESRVGGVVQGWSATWAAAPWR
jgi:hypothetical protein